MTRLRAVAGSVVAVVAVGSVAVAWLQGAEVTARDAVAIVEEGLADAGVDVQVDPDPEPGTFDSEARGEIRVWRVAAQVKDVEIRVLVDRADGAPVFIDDLVPDGTKQILTDAEVDRFAGLASNPALARAVRRNIAVTIAALLVVMLAVGLGPAALPAPPRSARAPARRPLALKAVGPGRRGGR